MRNGASPKKCDVGRHVSPAGGAARGRYRAPATPPARDGYARRDAYRSDQGGVGWRTSEAAHRVGATTT